MVDRIKAAVYEKYEINHWQKLRIEAIVQKMKGISQGSLNDEERVKMFKETVEEAKKRDL